MHRDVTREPTAQAGRAQPLPGAESPPVPGSESPAVPGSGSRAVPGSEYSAAVASLIRSSSSSRVST